MDRGVKFAGERSPFEDNAHLKTVVLGDKIQVVNDYLFRGCKNLTSLVMGNKVNSIGSHAFYGCRNLSSFSPVGSITVKEYAFYGCSGLKSLTIGNSIGSYQSYGSHAFDSCSGLKTIYINSHTTLNEYAFNNCTSIEEVYAYPEFPPNIYSTSFDEETFSNALLYVPEPSLSENSLYREYPFWSKFNHIIEKLPSGVCQLNVDSEDNPSIYDLQGRKVTTVQKKGLYIKNGKKYILK